jgi:uncharacterized protein YjbI with pentapeptide repeats
MLRAQLLAAALVAAVITISGTSPALANCQDPPAEGVTWDGCDVKGRSLPGADLRNAFISDADMSGADLTDARFNGSVLRATDLTGAKLAQSDFTSADLTGADLSGADLSGATLADAILTDAKLDGADLSGADLSGAILPSTRPSGSTARSVPRAPSGTVSNIGAARLGIRAPQFRPISWQPSGLPGIKARRPKISSIESLRQLMGRRNGHS